MKTPMKLENIGLAALMMLIAADAKAASAGTGFGLTALNDFVCKVIEWLRGDLAVMIFFIVVIVTVVVGLFAKMDWTKILSVIILFGLLQGLTSVFQGFISTTLKCLQ